MVNLKENQEFLVDFIMDIQKPSNFTLKYIYIYLFKKKMKIIAVLIKYSEA